MSKPGKLPSGKTEIPFEVPLRAKNQQRKLYETYHGVFVNIQVLWYQWLWCSASVGRLFFKIMLHDWWFFYWKSLKMSCFISFSIKHVNCSCVTPHLFSFHVHNVSHQVLMYLYIVCQNKSFTFSIEIIVHSEWKKKKSILILIVRFTTQTFNDKWLFLQSYNMLLKWDYSVV